MIYILQISVLSVQFHNCEYIYRVVQSSLQSYFRTFPSPQRNNPSSTFYPYRFVPSTGHCTKMSLSILLLRFIYIVSCISISQHISILYLNFLPLIILHNIFRYKCRTGAINEQRINLSKSASIVSESRFCTSCSLKVKNQSKCR